MKQDWDEAVNKYKRAEAAKADFWANIAGIAVVIVVLLLVGAFWVFASSREARVFRRLTGHEVSTWDAMWSSLRVQAQPLQAAVLAAKTQGDADNDGERAD